MGRGHGVAVPISGSPGLEPVVKLVLRPADFFRGKREIYHADDTLFLGTLGEFGAVEEVAGFADAVLEPRRLVFVVVEIVKVDAASGGVDFGGGGRHPDHADAVCRACLCRFSHEGEQELGEQEGTEVVGPELQLVALFCLAALRGRHDAGVVPEDIKAVFLAEKVFGGFLNGG